jgi:acetoacetyl-CoA synthetase
MTAPELLRAPAEDLRESTEIGRYLAWLAQHRGLAFSDYAARHACSGQDLGAFWSSVWEFSGVHAHTPATAALGRRDMPGAEWFPGATLNYAEHALRRADGALTDVAVLSYS